MWRATGAFRCNGMLSFAEFQEVEALTGRSRADAYSTPRWLKLAEHLLPPLVSMGMNVLKEAFPQDPDLGTVPICAMHHLVDCLVESMNANREGRHAVAVSLLRQCIEAMTLVDVGLQDQGLVAEVLRQWKDGRLTNGDVRAFLEQEVWPRYGCGLWDEPWTEFFSNLSRAVQPYAHYSPQLQGWQLAYLSAPKATGDGYIGTVLIGPQTCDPLKASRITLLFGLFCWVIGRLLLAFGRNPDVNSLRDKISELGNALGSSKLLLKRKDWALELLPDMWFKGVSDWIDEP